LWFQLYSHPGLYKDEGGDTAKSTVYSPRTRHFLPRIHKDEETAETAGPSSVPTSTEVTEGGETPQDELETPQMTLWTTILLLVIVTVVGSLIYTLGYFHIDSLIQLVAVTAEWLVDSINGLTESGHISKEFVGVILLPIVGNAAGSCATSLLTHLYWLSDASLDAK
jgi:Ca2+:H+ antiporter